MAEGGGALRSRVCPVCGREVNVLYGGMCEECFRSLHPLVELPPLINVTVCPICGAYKLGERWIEPRGEDPLLEAVSEAVKRVAKSRYRIERIEVAGVEGNTVRVRVTGSAIDGLSSYEEEYVTGLRLHHRLCRSCIYARAKREVARVQVRARNRELTAVEVAVAKNIVERALSARRRGSLDMVEVVEKPQALDFVFSTLSSAKLAVEALRRELPVTILETRKSAGVDSSGKRLAKVTFRLLLPEFRAGDVVEFGGKLYYVTRVSGEGVWALDLNRMREVKLEVSKALVEGSRVARKREEGRPVIVASLKQGNIDVVTVREGEMLSLPAGSAPIKLKEGEQAILLEIEGKYYLLPPVQ